MFKKVIKWYVGITICGPHSLKCSLSRSLQIQSHWSMLHHVAKKMNWKGKIHIDLACHSEQHTCPVESKFRRDIKLASLWLFNLILYHSHENDPWHHPLYATVLFYFFPLFSDTQTFPLGSRHRTMHFSSPLLGALFVCLLVCFLNSWFLWYSGYNSNVGL